MEIPISPEAYVSLPDTHRPWYAIMVAASVVGTRDTKRIALTKEYIESKLAIPQE